MAQARGYGRTDVGVVRDHNEDAYLVDDELQLYVVADGMGGHHGGEIASAEAVRSVQEHVSRTRGSPTPTPLEEIARQAILHACGNVFALSQTDRGKPGMGCTLTLLVARGDRAAVGHAGDSRLYRSRGGNVSLVTRDHTMVQRLFERGKITADEARGHPLAHVLVNAVGLEADCEVDVTPLELDPGDRFLLCSDGLTNTFTDAERLGALVDGASLEDATSALIRHALDAGAEDNVTVLLVDVDRGSVEREPSPLLDAVDHLPGEIRILTRGEALIHEGDALACWAVVKSGALSVVRWNAELRVVRRGQAVGAEALFAARPARGTVRALERSEVLVLDRSAFERLEVGLRVEVLALVAADLASRARAAGVVDV